MSSKKEAEQAAGSANEAAAAGQRIFVWSYRTSFSRANGLAPVAEQIEAIEAVGWHLEHFSTSISPSFAKELVATCVFRRATS
jgi:hypothetical protein